MRNLAVLSSLLLAAACTTEADVSSFEDSNSTSGASIHITPDLSGCNGTASSTIPASGNYVMTTFGGGADTQPMSCGGTANGVGWYAASRQRYGCGAHLQVEANGKCVVVSAMDYGPDVCVEAAADSPVLDMSPAAAELLYGVSGAGWSNHLVVNAVEVSSDTPLGPCTATTSGGGGGGTSGGGTSGGGGTGSASGGGTSTGTASCASATLARNVDDGECVQSASDGNMYECDNGDWDEVSGTSSCTDVYAYCDSPTLGRSVPARACVQSGSTGIWYQCNGTEWTTPVNKTAETGPIGACSEWDPN